MIVEREMARGPTLSVCVLPRRSEIRKAFERYQDQSKAPYLLTATTNAREKEVEVFNRMTKEMLLDKPSENESDTKE